MGGRNRRREIQILTVISSAELASGKSRRGQSRCEDRVLDHDEGLVEQQGRGRGDRHAVM